MIQLGQYLYFISPTSNPLKSREADSAASLQVDAHVGENATTTRQGWKRNIYWKDLENSYALSTFVVQGFKALTNMKHWAFFLWKVQEPGQQCKLAKNGKGLTSWQSGFEKDTDGRRAGLHPPCQVNQAFTHHPSKSFLPALSLLDSPCTTGF